MKVNIIISVVKAISAWLHGEGGKHFRTYTYPRIKAGTRRFFNLGIYEKIEGLYKIVDDTYYKGAIDITPQDPLEIERLESLAEVIEDRGLDTDGASALPKFEDVKDDLYIWKGLEQGNTYRCGTFSMNNMLRTQMLKQGLLPDLEVTAIDPLYIATKHGKGQTGTVMDNAFDYLNKVGFPIPSWTPRMTNHNKELTALESSKVIGNAKNFSVIKTTGQKKFAYTFAEAVRLDKELPANWEMQVSVSFCASLKWFGQMVPFLQKIGDKYSLTRTGGHSVHGVRGSFSTWEDGEEGFGIIESAYRSSENGFRFVKAKLFTYGLITVRFIEFSTTVIKPEIPVVTPPVVNPTPTPTNKDHQILTNKVITFGETGENVKALQRFLIKEGFAIAAGVTGNFFEQTQKALKGWQDKQFGAKYDGTYWGSISQAKYIEINKLG